MINSETLIKGQKLRIELDKVFDRLPKKILAELESEPYGVWTGGYKMVDGNSFGLVLELKDGRKMWFFESELFEV